ncbi:MAG: hypothetical protein HGA65_07505 [Oscillochloris sp.]|nr:hypothetical protein [Oscillochloris sp.]
MGSLGDGRQQQRRSGNLRLTRQPANDITASRACSAESLLFTTAARRRSTPDALTTPPPPRGARRFLSFAIFVLALAHGVWSGSDTATSWAQWLYAASGLSVVGLTACRIQVGQA